MPTSKKKFHFVGVGGIGMSGVAEVLHDRGYTVQGSDINANDNTKRLQEKGVPVFLGHKAAHLHGVDTLVVSTAVSSENPEVAEAQLKGIEILHRSQALALVMADGVGVAISGAHGKTTTTSLLASVAEAGELSPTIINGGILGSYGSNAKSGKGRWVIAEADESDGSFLNLPAAIRVVTNIDHEHLNHYGSFEKVQEAFQSFVQGVPQEGLVLLCADDPETMRLADHLDEDSYLTYGFSEIADICGETVTPVAAGKFGNLEDAIMSFSVSFSAKARMLFAGMNLPQRAVELNLPLPGAHNVLNALAALGCGLKMGVSVSKIQAGLSCFKGVARRFTPVGVFQGAQLIDDYAHHPAEIEALLKGARSICAGRLIAVVQPHRYSRLQSLFSEFSTCFSEADHVVVTPVYEAGETPLPGVDHQHLASKISQYKIEAACAVDSFEQLKGQLERLKLDPQDYVIFMGAGSISKWAHALGQQVYDKAWDGPKISPAFRDNSEFKIVSQV